MEELIVQGEKRHNLEIRSPKVRKLLEDLYIDYYIDNEDNLVLFEYKGLNFYIKRACGLDYFINKMLEQAHEDGYKAGVRSLGSSIISVIHERKNRL